MPKGPKLAELRQFLDLAPDAMLVVCRDGRIMAANAAAQSLFQTPREELEGTSVEDLVPTVSRISHRQFREDYMSSPERKPMAPRELQAQLRDGTHIPVEVSIAPMTVDDEECVAASIRDVSERILRQENLERRKRELERSNKELEQFAYMTLVNSQEIASKVGKQRRDVGKDEDVFDEVSNSATRMSAVTRRMLNYALLGIGDSTPSNTDLNPVLSRAMNNLSHLIASREATIEADELPEVWGNPTSLTQVFQHLLENSLLFCERRPEIRITSRPLGDMVEISVRDNGIGIEDRHLELIFEMFQRLHSRDKYPSSGMGLAACRKIVEHHGGRIRAESKVGEGTTIIFTIPAAPEVLDDLD